MSRVRTAKPPPRTIYNWDRLPMILEVPQVAWLLNETPESIRAKARAGIIPGKRLGGGCWKFSRDKIRALLEGEINE